MSGNGKWSRGARLTRAKAELRARIMDDPDLKSTSQMVGIYLVDTYINYENLGAWVSQARLAEELCRSVRTIQRALALLCKKGYIVIIQRAGTTNFYRFPLIVRRMSAGK